MSSENSIKCIDYGDFFGSLSVEELSEVLGEGAYLDEYLEAYATPMDEKSL